MCRFHTRVQVVMSDHSDQPVNLIPASRPTQPMTRWGRPLAITTAVLFGVSSMFPVVAGFVKDTEAWPKLWGVLDVVIAFVLAFLAITVTSLFERHVTKPVEEASYRAYRVLLHGLFVMLVVFFLAGDRIVWINCLTGFTWRAWLLLYSLPAWLAAYRSESASKTL